MKIILIVLALTLTTPAFATGPYDGIWFSDVIGFVSLHENNGSVVIIRLAAEGDLWEASSGPRFDTSIRLESIQGYSGVRSVVNINMTSNTTFTATQVSCQPALPGFSCLLPNGFTFYGHKIW